MSTFLGYLIGGLFVCLMVAPIPIAGWLVYDRVERFANAEQAEATITECYRHSRSSGGTNKISWGPLAVTATSIKVKGDFKWSDRDWCEVAVGDKVTVLLHQDGDHRIFSFLQFWALPLLMVTICLVFYPLSYRAKQKKQHANPVRDQP